MIQVRVFEVIGTFEWMLVKYGIPENRLSFLLIQVPITPFYHN